MHDKNVADTYSITKLPVEVLNLSLTFSSQSQERPWPGLFAICVFIGTRLGARWPSRPLTHHAVHSARDITSHTFRRRRHWAETPWYFFSWNQAVRDNCLVMKARSIWGIHWSIAFSIILLCLGHLQQVSKPWSRNMDAPSAIHNVSVQENLLRSNMIFKKVDSMAKFSFVILHRDKVGFF